MIERVYREWLGDLIAIQDRIFNQIGLIADPEERAREMRRYRMTSLNAQMLREIKGILRSLKDDNDYRA